MGYPSITGDALPALVRDEFESHDALFQGWAEVEHTPGGRHTDITAETITATALTGAVTITSYERQTSILSPAQMTANQNDYDPEGLSTARTIHLHSDAARDLTGIAAQAEGFLLRLRNTGSFPITLRNLSGSSISVNQLAIMADTVLAADAVLNVQYAASKWRLA